MAQSIAGTMAGLFTACAEEVYAEAVDPVGTAVLVCDGRPGQYQPDAVIAVNWAVRMPITKPTMGTGRSREQLAEIDVLISVFVAGDEASQPIANASALDLQGLLESYLRVNPNQALGGACADSFVSNSVLVPEIVYQLADDPDQTPIAVGRVAELTVTVTARVRY